MERGYTMDELWTAVRRRARLGLVVTGALLVFGAILLVSLPNEYQAEATIIVEPYRPHADLVTPTVTTLLEDRLRVARQQLLAAPLLGQVVAKFDLYPKLKASHGLDAAVDNLRAHLEIKPDGDSAVVLAFRTDRQEIAAPVVAMVADGFVTANATLRESQARRVLASIDGELTNVRQDLDSAEAKVRGFRLEHDGELPEQVDENVRDADRASHLLDSAQVYLRQLADRRSMLPSTPTSPELEHLAAVEADLVRDYQHAVATEAEGYPERVRLERELAGLRAEKQRQIARIDSLERERREIDASLRRTRAEAGSLQERVKVARDRAEAGARWQTALAVLERDRDMLSDKYKSLAGRKVESEVSLSLEAANGPVGTRVVDPPAVPDAPASPDRLKLLLVLVVLSLAAGAGAGVLAETRDVSLRTPADARAQLEVPLLAVLPSLRATGRT